MIRHIVMWTFKSGVSSERRPESAAHIKLELESLKARIDGIESMRVYTSPMPGSNTDIMMDSLFVSGEALNAYQIHPEHTHVSRFLGTLVEERYCFDCEAEV